MFIGLGARLILSALLEDFSGRGISFFTIYLCICFAMSLPIILYVWDILYSSPVPAGGDPADHALFTMKILDSRNPLIEYTQFPTLISEQNTTQAYYPSFLHVLTAIPAYFMQLMGTTPFNSVISSMTATMFVSYILGIIGYALISYLFLINVISEFQVRVTSKTIKSLILLITALLAWGIFMYSTSPILKTFRDGGYGEVLSMWTILPFYILCLFRGRWVIAGIFFGMIASTHNISIMLTLAVTVAFVISLLVSREMRQIGKLWKLGVTAAICSIPAFVYFYYPVIVATVNEQTGLSGQSALWTRADIAGQIGNVLYYLGIIAILGLLFLNYRKSSWLVCWVILYLVPFYFNIFFLERLAREFSLPFGLGLATFTASLMFVLVTRFYPRIASKIGASTKGVPIMQALICIIVSSVIVSLYYDAFAPRFEMFGLSSILTYYSDALFESNSFLLNSSHSENETVVLFGVNPWLKPYSFRSLPILEVETADVENSLSKTDSRVNKELRSIIENPTSSQAENAMRKYHVKYIYLSDTLEGRWYPESQRRLISEFTNFEETYDRNKISLERQWRGEDGEIIQIYRVQSS
jgi:hypothetical protein